ncbi:ABC transporter permease [Aurantimonas sp. C2-6-R+9]|uniref:ABC transporter permease n=1 Tax=unclassified Aurantimonas TaxID=2638230 RepID=UPI002E19A86F|nr:MULTISPECIES: ABC transporter permease [unclassified Aurantimonas]MEC5382946.1 ABC transporter permease [Aurantimonas sp. C2-6-R+9]MEC5413817.1 ABC transporter permease [Aurantimonas sp. C2-4-R8]
MFGLWIKGIFKRRAVQIALAYSGVAIAVALIALIGVFSVISASTMTERAVAQVVVDWQVQPKLAADSGAIKTALEALPSIRAVSQVDYADMRALQATTGGTVQTTGAAKVFGIDAGYRSAFPEQMRLLLGSLDGPVLAQQTAANLHAGIGDSIQILRRDGAASTITVAGIVELPNADALFQSIGAPAGAGPTAPPDNVVILPATQWSTLFAADTSGTVQFHAAFIRAALARYPDTAFIEEARQVRNFEASIAGQALVGDNLGARLDAVRGDAIYARVIFLFLGLPAAVLAILLTVSLLLTDRDHKSRNEALLRIRGFDRSAILRLIASEEAIGAAGAAIVGSLAALILSALQFGTASLSSSALMWIALSGIGGFAVALLCGILPALRRLRGETVLRGRTSMSRGSDPLWQRLWLDLIFLAGAVVIFLQSASSNYQVVLAPEGVTATAVDYTAFLSPLLFWVGSVLLTIRLASWWIGRSAGTMEATTIRIGLAKATAPSVAAGLSRQHRRIAGGIALVSLAFSFAVAASIFNLTYNGQTRVDAMLTNGADVTVTGSTATPVGPVVQTIQAMPGVVAAVPMQHRFAYVGNDLQDIYGIDPTRIGKATAVEDAYFANKNAAATLKALETNPDGVLVSQETVNDFQLAIGDPIKLRLQNAKTHQYEAISFKFVGVALEFPTAPKDSFLVANASYLATQTGSSAHELLLVRSLGDPKALAAAIRQDLGSTSGYTVTDLESAFHIIASSLTAVDLGRLTTVEIAFAVVLLAAATGLMLFFGFAERKRTAEILAALGASGAEIGGFLWSEALLILVPGTVIGSLIGVVAADMLVKLLSGIFDPPPDALSYPLIQLIGFALVGVVATVAAVQMARLRLAREVAA